MWEDNPVTGGGDLIGTSFLHSSINAVLELLSALNILEISFQHDLVP